jgi:hypothetical protein
MGTEQSGRGEVGSRKHGKSGQAGHNRDMIQVNREFNAEREEQARIKAARQGTVAESVRELMEDT